MAIWGELTRQYMIIIHTDHYLLKWKTMKTKFMIFYFLYIEYVQ